ncbi:kinase-like domain-containing protein [Mycena crocata]|nr:kinase-like domain-containing protein [Mycena crocata]
MASPVEGSIQTCGTDKCKLVLNITGVANGSSAPSTGAIPLGPSLAVNASNETTAGRVDLLRARMKLPPANSSSKNNTPGTHLNTAALLAHENGGGLPGDPKIMVCWEVRSNKNSKLDATLGSSSKKWSTTKYLSDIKADTTQVINVEWTQRNLIPLDDTETAFRWCFDRLLEPNTATMTLGDFYTYHSTPSNSPIYLQEVPKKWKHYLKSAKTQPFICLELYIKHDAWTARKDAIENNGTIADDITSAINEVATRKRRRTESESSGGQPPKQKQSLAIPLLSEFSLSTRTGRAVIHKQSDITFKKITCITTVATGNPRLVITGDIVRGQIFDKPFASGTMKNAFDLILPNGEQYVAKCFFKLTDSESESTVSVEENRVEVEGEISRIAMGKWFLDAFYRFCKSKKEISVDNNIMFTDAFLAEEVDRPSTASGVPLITEDDGLTWLVEQKRPTNVIKFTGTLIHHIHRRDLRSATISAFSHFVYGFSKHSLVVADLQGTPCLVKGKEALVLFDLMTHTQDGESGIGDFGPRGINSFVEGHNCTDLCRLLNLDSSYPLNEEDDGGGGENDDEDDDDDEDDQALQIHA